MLSKKITIQGQQFLIDGKQLGSGNQGSVFKIVHIASGIVYAVKIVRTSDKAVIGALQNEINILKNIRSPYVIGIMPYSIVSERYSYMIMDYCEGGDLKQHYKRLLLGKVPIDQKRIKKLIYDCTQGYKQLEKNQVLHMDIKLQNILIKKNKYALADFGLSKLCHQSKKTAGGTILYFSPARFRKKPNQVNSLDDLFAFGVVVYEFSNSLNHPYYTQQMLALREQSKMPLLEYLYKCLISAPTRKMTHYSPYLTSLLEKMLERDQNARLTWKQLYNQVDNSPEFQFLRVEENKFQLKLIMPILDSGEMVSSQDIHQSNVAINLLKSDYKMDEAAEAQKLYQQLREYLCCRIDVCGFLARVVDIIQVYNSICKRNEFSAIQLSLLKVMEQMSQLENVKQLDLPVLENSPQRIQIQIDKIRDQFQRLLAIKNKVNCFKQYLKLNKKKFPQFSSIQVEIMHLQENMSTFNQQLQVIHGLKQIKQDFTSATSVFKLILYLLQRTGVILKEKNPLKQRQLLPKFGSIIVDQKDYNDAVLFAQVQQFLSKHQFIVTVVDSYGVVQLDDLQSDEEHQTVLLNRMGKYSELY